MNLFKLLGLLLANKVKGAADEVLNSLEQTMHLLVVAVIVPAVLIVAGVAAGSLGTSIQVPWVVEAGRIAILLGGLFAAALFALFWVRAALAAEVIVLSSNAAAALGVKVRAVTKTEAEKFMQWLRGVTAWITFVAIYAQVVPLWRNIGMTIIVATCLLFLSAVMTANWFCSPWTRRIATLTVMMIFLYGTVDLASPESGLAIRQVAGSYFGKLTGWSERKSQLAEVRREADHRMTQSDQDLMRRFVARQDELRQRAIACNGDFCSPAEKEEYRRLGDNIDRLQKGNYWQEEAKPAGARDPGDKTTIRRLPPPPAGNGSVDTPDANPSSTPSPKAGAPKRSPKDQAEIDRILQQYPDL